MKRNVIELLFTAAKVAIFNDPHIDLDTHLVERREDQSPILPEGADELAFREVMLALGVGRQNNLTPSETGATDGYVAIVEGGQGHKMLAELILILNGPIPAKIIFMAGSRKVSDAERTITAKVLDVTEDLIGETEMDVANLVATRAVGFEVEFKLLTNGESNAIRLQQIRAANPNKQLVLVTSCTYLPSRRIDAEKSATGVVVAGYGSLLLTKVKDEKLKDKTANVANTNAEQTSVQTPMNQLISELYGLNKTLSMS